MKKELKTALTFNDVLIRPQSSKIEPKDTISKTEIAKGLFVDLPFMSAAMDKVTESKMAIALAEFGAIGVLHRNCTVEEQVEMVKKTKKANKKYLVGAAVGPFDTDRALALEKADCDLIVIDCAHGHNLKVIKSGKEMKKKLKKAKLVMGNVATKEGAEELVSFADAIKVGVGPGSICTSRIVSGVGMPQFSAILEVVDVAKKHNVPVIADGGMSKSADIAKAIGAGASAVMMGNMFSATKEAPGKIIKKGKKKYKEYRGMGSKAVLNSRKSKVGDRYLGKEDEAVAEGVQALVEYKGSVLDIIKQLKGGLQVAMGYVGAKTIKEMHKKAKFVFITKAGVRESQPHNLDFVIKDK